MVTSLSMVAQYAEIGTNSQWFLDHHDDEPGYTSHRWRTQGKITGLFAFLLSNVCYPGISLRSKCAEARRHGRVRSERPDHRLVVFCILLILRSPNFPDSGPRVCSPRAGAYSFCAHRSRGLYRERSSARRLPCRADIKSTTTRQRLVGPTGET